MLSEHKIYRTRDGSRTGIRVRKDSVNGFFRCTSLRSLAPVWWFSDGQWVHRADRDEIFDGWDLLEESLEPASSRFSYDACPIVDGRRRAVTRGGRKVVLLCNDAPGLSPIRGYYALNGAAIFRSHDGRMSNIRPDQEDLLVPPPPKRTVWVNLSESAEVVSGIVAIAWNTQEESEKHAPPHRLGNRAFPIEIEATP